MGPGEARGRCGVRACDLEQGKDGVEGVFGDVGPGREAGCKGGGGGEEGPEDDGGEEGEGGGGGLEEEVEELEGAGPVL